MAACRCSTTWRRACTSFSSSLSAMSSVRFVSAYLRDAPPSARDACTAESLSPTPFRQHTACQDSAGTPGAATCDGTANYRPDVGLLDLLDKLLLLAHHGNFLRKVALEGRLVVLRPLACVCAKRRRRLCARLAAAAARWSHCREQSPQTRAECGRSLVARRGADVCPPVTPSHARTHARTHAAGRPEPGPPRRACRALNGLSTASQLPAAS